MPNHQTLVAVGVEEEETREGRDRQMLYTNVQNPRWLGRAAACYSTGSDAAAAAAAAAVTKQPFRPGRVKSAGPASDGPALDCTRWIK